MKITCVGAGPAGLVFASLMKLRHPRCDITVVERRPKHGSAGWGVVFWDDLCDELRQVDPIIAGELKSSAFHWTHQVVECRGDRAVNWDSNGYSIRRDVLIDLLRRRAMSLGVGVEYGTEVTTCSDLRDSDLIVVADGASSNLRGEGRFGTTITRGDNKYLWLGTTKPFDSFTFPFVRTSAGWIWAHAYGIGSDFSTFVVECKASTWVSLGYDQHDGSAGLKQLERIFASQLEGHPLFSTTSSNEKLPWQTFQQVTNRHWYDHNVVLLGDAAHTTHFSIGSGTKLACLDAIALVNNLDSGKSLEDALHAYESERQLALSEFQTEAHFSAQWFEQIDRYVERPAREVMELLMARRSPLLARVPPRTYYFMHRLSDQAMLHELRDRYGLELQRRAARRRSRANGARC